MEPPHPVIFPELHDLRVKLILSERKTSMQILAYSLQSCLKALTRSDGVLKRAIIQREIGWLVNEFHHGEIVHGQFYCVLDYVNVKLVHNELGPGDVHFWERIQGNDLKNLASLVIDK